MQTLNMVVSVLEQKYETQMKIKNEALALLEVIQRAPKSVRCNTHHTIHVDADIMRLVDALLKKGIKNA
tara:strand:+ start:6011 stop:6217 length:207 start_codon:yes stop_codon:yes gene_type:complete